MNPRGQPLKYNVSARHRGQPLKYNVSARRWGQPLKYNVSARRRGQTLTIIFSTLWKKSFHSVENVPKSFPYRGKPSPIFPQCGRKVSTVWKTAALLLAAFVLLHMALLTGCSRSTPPPARTLPAGKDAVATAALSTNRIHIGDPVRLDVTVLHREGIAVEFPSVAKGKDIIVRDSATATSALANDLATTEQTIHFTSMTVTNHILADGATISLATPKGLSWTVSFPFVSLEVASALAPGETDPRPIKDTLADWPAPLSRWIWVALAGLILLAAAAAILYRVLSTPRTFLHMPPAIPPHQIALDAIAALRAKGWIEARTIEPFYVELSAIIRRYLEARFGLRAPERTTEEFIRDALTARTLTPPHRDLVAGFLAQSDLVKFARHAPGSDDMRNALDSATRLVQETNSQAPASPPSFEGGAS